MPGPLTVLSPAPMESNPMDGTRDVHDNDSHAGQRVYLRILSGNCRAEGIRGQTFAKESWD